MMDINKLILWKLQLDQEFLQGLLESQKDRDYLDGKWLNEKIEAYVLDLLENSANFRDFLITKVTEGISIKTIFACYLDFINFYRELEQSKEKIKHTLPDFSTHGQGWVDVEENNGI